MIIDAKKYNGTCSCGREHAMTTEFCIIEDGCMADLPVYLDRYGLKGYSVAIYDDNTYNAKGMIRPKVDKEIVLPAEGLHPDDRSLQLILDMLPEECDFMIAIGAGSIHDLTRYCAYERGIPFVACPTAASVDGFCSSVAVVTWHGFKKTTPAASPKLVIADLNIISQAPLYLSKSGFCDMVGKFIALADWRIANTLTGEYFCDRIYDMTLEATKAVIECAAEIKKGEKSAYEKLMYGLLMSGLAMQMLGNSRCASGAEHHISHIIEMQPESLAVNSSALHGEKVGVGTLIASREYHRLRELKNVSFRDYPRLEEAYLKGIFGEALVASVVEENAKDCAAGITAEMMEKCWDKICSIIDEIPSGEELLEVYKLLDAKSTLTDIEVDESKLGELIEYSPLVRNRLTLMRLRRTMVGEV